MFLCLVVSDSCLLQLITVIYQTAQSWDVTDLVL